MNCQELDDFLMDYLEGRISAGERAEFERHLAACPPCVQYLESYEQTVKLGRCLCSRPGEPVPEDVPAALVQAILAARKEGRR